MRTIAIGLVTSEIGIIALSEINTCGVKRLFINLIRNWLVDSFANKLRHSIGQFLNWFDAEVLFVVVSFVNFILLEIVWDSSQNLLNLLLFNITNLLVRDRGVRATTIWVVPILKFIRQNHVVLSLAELLMW